MKRSTIERYRDSQGRSRPVRKRAKKRGPVPDCRRVGFRRYKCQMCRTFVTNSAQQHFELSLTRQGFKPKPVKLCPSCVRVITISGSDHSTVEILRKAWNG